MDAVLTGGSSTGSKRQILPRARACRVVFVVQIGDLIDSHSIQRNLTKRNLVQIEVWITYPLKFTSFSLLSARRMLSNTAATKFTLKDPDPERSVLLT